MRRYPAQQQQQRAPQTKLVVSTRGYNCQPPNSSYEPPSPQSARTPSYPPQQRVSTQQIRCAAPRVTKMSPPKPKVSETRSGNSNGNRSKKHDSVFSTSTQGSFPSPSLPYYRSPNSAEYERISYDYPTDSFNNGVESLHPSASSTQDGYSAIRSPSQYNPPHSSHTHPSHASQAPHSQTPQTKQIYNPPLKQSLKYTATPQMNRRPVAPVVQPPPIPQQRRQSYAPRTYEAMTTRAYEPDSTPVLVEPVEPAARKFQRTRDPTTPVTIKLYVDDTPVQRMLVFPAASFRKVEDLIQKKCEKYFKTTIDIEKICYVANGRLVRLLEEEDWLECKYNLRKELFIRLDLIDCTEAGSTEVDAAEDIFAAYE